MASGGNMTMDKAALRSAMIDRIGHRLQRLGIDPAEVTSDLDLVRSGVLDSLAFVDLVADLCVLTGKEVDLEAALDRKDATTVNGILELFQ